ncbi:DUF6802 family protein [Rhodococcus sp. 27YEA15]|uniref:DUF6802 family protein n=1 Tax=Rhodococcus sp. 27YEA15 TaxID=3156259 RepID=UPI003C7C1413
MSAVDVEVGGVGFEPLDPGGLGVNSHGDGPAGDVTFGVDNFELYGFDLDGDGAVDSHVMQVGDTILVVSDFDRDGTVDQLSAIESDGDYTSWECRRNPDGELVWEKTDAGSL